MSTSTSIKNRHLTIVEALREALYEELKRDKSIFLMGQDIATKNGWGGPFTVCMGLVEEYGPERIMNAPISEKAIIGSCIGAAMMGLRPICEVQYSDFLFCAMDEIVNEAAKMKYMSNGQFKVPMVIRAPTGATTRGAQHSQSPEGFFMHVPGIKVVAPSNSYDAKGLMKAAIRDDSPVLFFEHKLLYGSKNRNDSAKHNITTYVPLNEYTVDIGKAEVKKEGKDITIISILYMLNLSILAAEELEDMGISAEVIDLRTILPLDKETLIKSIGKTRRALVVEEDTKTLGWGAEVIAMLAEEKLDSLKYIGRLATKDVSIPFAPNLEKYVIPSKQDIVEKVKKIVKNS